MGFQDAFGKASDGEENLQYDDAAFLFFIFGMISFLQLILVTNIYKNLKKTKKFKKSCPCPECLAKTEKLK